jgi:hypothetical protein
MSLIKNKISYIRILLIKKYFLNKKFYYNDLYDNNSIKNSLDKRFF